MLVEHLELVDFRNYRQATFDLTAGTTCVVGQNGQGKTNLAEALAYLSGLTSFRQAPSDALIRVGADQAIIRAQIVEADGRQSLVEVEISRVGRGRVQVNRQRLQRTRDLLGTVRTSVFSPDDLTLVKGGPSERRRFLDDTLVALATKNDALRLEVDRVLKQRNTLLRQCGGRLDDDASTTLDVWDSRLVDVGERLGRGRAALVERLRPLVAEAYQQLAGESNTVSLAYDPQWRHEGLAAALAAARRDDVRRGVSTVGPHRDDVDLSVNELPARTHASQGEQRTLALSLRLGAHRLVTDHVGSSPILILDDVLSELDNDRATALLGELPAGQVVITTAAPLPPAAQPERVVKIDSGTVMCDE
ncbi:MAG: DNA replication/repair protein RecF [Ilumatobacteraceae bacterium]